MPDLRGKTLFITGSTRGIGLAIALRAARDGASVAVVGKTTEPHPRLPGTIHSAAEEIEALGGRALAIACDIRFEDQVRSAVARTAEAFGGIDVCVNNASAIALSGTLATEMKRFDLMMAVNVRGAFLCSRETVPWLRRAANPHILNLSPPLDMSAKWFGPHVAYSIAKYGMSLCTLGMAAEFERDGIAVNSLWPVSTIDTAAVRNLLGGERAALASRTPQVMADAAHAILTKRSRECTGNFFLDEEVLRNAGKTDFTAYATVSDEHLARDFFVPDDFFERVPSNVGKAKPESTRR